MDKYFKRSIKWRKILNRHNLRIAFSCILNVKKKLPVTPLSRTYVDSASRLQNECPLVADIIRSVYTVYKSGVFWNKSSKNKCNNNTNTEAETKTNGRVCESKFKIHLNNYKPSTRAPDVTTLAANMAPKNEYTYFNIRYDLKETCKPYPIGRKLCKLCITEWYFVLMISHEPEKGMALIAERRSRDVIRRC